MQASLDRALRLVFAAQEFGAKWVNGADDSGPPQQDTTCRTQLRNYFRLLLAPAPSTTPRQRGRHGGAGRGGSDGLGLLVTAAKRAQLLAARLDAAAGSRPVPAQRQQLCALLGTAVPAMRVLLSGLAVLKEKLRQQRFDEEAALALVPGSCSRGSAAPAAGAGVAGPWDYVGDGCQGEAHEALAFAVRAACGLATLLAHVLACALPVGESVTANCSKRQSTRCGAPCTTWQIGANASACCPHHSCLHASLTACSLAELDLGPLYFGACAVALLWLAAHPHVSDRVFDWLAALPRPPPPGLATANCCATTCSTDGDGTAAAAQSAALPPVQGSEADEGHASTSSSRSAGGAMSVSQHAEALRGCLLGPLWAARRRLAVDRLVAAAGSMMAQRDLSDGEDGDGMASGGGMETKPTQLSTRRLPGALAACRRAAWMQRPAETPARTPRRKAMALLYHTSPT